MYAGPFTLIPPDTRAPRGRGCSRVHGNPAPWIEPPSFAPAGGVVGFALAAGTALAAVIYTRYTSTARAVWGQIFARIGVSLRRETEFLVSNLEYPIGKPQEFSSLLFFKRNDSPPPDMGPTANHIIIGWRANTAGGKASSAPILACVRKCRVGRRVSLARVAYSAYVSRCHARALFAREIKRRHASRVGSTVIQTRSQYLHSSGGHQPLGH